MFIGTYNHQLDQKNRFRIPAKFKQGLGDSAVITRGANGCLFLFSTSELDESIFSKMKDISLFDETAQKSFRLLLSSAYELEEDNQGRCLMPTELKSYAGITKDIVIIGVGRRLEIWAKEKWVDYSKELDFDEETRKLKDYGV